MRRKGFWIGALWWIGLVAGLGYLAVNPELFQGSKLAAKPAPQVKAAPAPSLLARIIALKKSILARHHPTPTPKPTKKPTATPKAGSKTSKKPTPSPTKKH